MLVILTEKDNSQLTKTKLAEKLNKSDTTVGNITRELHNIGLIDIHTDYSIEGTSKQYLTLNTPKMLFELVMEITENKKIANYYSQSYANLKARLPLKDDIDYPLYYNKWKDLFSDDIIKDFIKKSPSIMISFILFFDLLLSVAEVDQSLAKDDILANIAVPVRADFLISRILPEDIFRLFVGLLAFNIKKLFEEVTNLSFTNRLKFWLNSWDLNLLKLTTQQMKILDIDLSPKAKIKSGYNKMITLLYDYYKNNPENILIFLKNPVDQLFNLKDIFSSINWNETKHSIKIPVSAIPFPNETDLNKKPIMKIFLKNGSFKEYKVEFKEIMLLKK